MNDKNVLVIDKDTKLTRINNRKEYTKLILNKEVFYRALYGFANVKEIEINNSNESHYNEKNLKHVSFLSNLERISFKNIKVLGRGDYNNKKMNINIGNYKH